MWVLFDNGKYYLNPIIGETDKWRISFEKNEKPELTHKLGISFSEIPVQIINYHNNSNFGIAKPLPISLILFVCDKVVDQKPNEEIYQYETNDLRILEATCPNYILTILKMIGGLLSEIEMDKNRRLILDHYCGIKYHEFEEVDY